MEPSLAAPPAAFEPLLDREMALSRAGGDIGLLREIAMLFLDNHAKWVAEIREAAELAMAKLWNAPRTDSKAR
jgi:hypothetical protein